MAIVLDSPAPSAHPTTLLSTLKGIVTLHTTRRSLLAELDLSLSSFLSPSSSTPGTAPDVLSAPSDPDFPPARMGSSCQGEALNPPPPRSDEELQELLRIAFGGLVEVKEEVRVLQESLDKHGSVGERLEVVVGKVEGWESERVRATLELYQLRRLLLLQPELAESANEKVKEKESLRKDLAIQIQEEMQEIRAEITDLQAAEDEAKQE